MASKIDLKNAVIRHGQAICTPGGCPNSMDRNSPLHPRNGKAKNFTVGHVASAHGVHPSDIEKGVIGAHKGHMPDAGLGHGVPVAFGMQHSHKGKIVAGISRTQAAFDDEPNTPLPTTPRDVFDVNNHPLPHGYHQTPGVRGLSGALPAQIKK